MIFYSWAGGCLLRALPGKWHLGDSVHPQHGFSHWYTIGCGGCQYMLSDIVEDGKVHFETHYITDLITNRALEYLDNFADQQEPFYVSVHYTAPHDPWDEDQHPKEYVDMYRDCEFTATPNEPLHPNLIPTAPSGVGEVRERLLWGYYAAVTAMDAGVGKLLEDKEADNHIVILDEYGSSRMIRTRGWKYIHRYPYGPHELYHLSVDPDKKVNLIEDAQYAPCRGIFAGYAGLRRQPEISKVSERRLLRKTQKQFSIQH